MVNEERAYILRGMTCGHCRSSVIEEVSEVAGADSVEVDLESGRLTVSGAGFTDESVRAAVGEAGYELVEASG